MPMINNIIDTQVTAWQRNMLWINIEFWLLNIISTNYDNLDAMPMENSRMKIHQSIQGDDHRIGNARIF
jgi:hypothetical protein